MSKEGNIMTGHNLNNREHFDALKADIAEICGGIESHKVTRAHTNEAIAELRARAEAKGISKQALDWAMKYANMKPEKKPGFDLAYALVREALGDPIQEDLFSAAEKIQEKKDKIAETEARLEIKPDAKAIAEAVFDQNKGKKGGNEKTAASKVVESAKNEAFDPSAVKEVPAKERKAAAAKAKETPKEDEEDPFASALPTVTKNETQVEEVPDDVKKTMPFDADEPIDF